MSNRTRWIFWFSARICSASRPELATKTVCCDAVSLRARYSVLAGLSSTTSTFEGYLVSNRSGVSSNDSENFSTKDTSSLLRTSWRTKLSTESMSPLCRLSTLPCSAVAAVWIRVKSVSKSSKNALSPESLADASSWWILLRNSSV